jgi:hypothetical protein
MVIYLDGKSKTDWKAVIPGRCVSIEPRISCHNLQIPGCSLMRAPRDESAVDQLSTFSAAMKASCGMSTLPNCRIFFLPSFCFSRSFRLRVMSPP